MAKPDSTSKLRYVAVIALTATALFLTSRTEITRGVSFFLLYPTVAFAAYWGGVGPGIVALFLSIAGSLTFLVNYNEQSIASVAARHLAFAAFSAFIVVIQKRREDTASSLRATEKGLLEAHQIAQLWSWWLDLKTQNVWWSDQHYAILGLDKAKVKPNHLAFINAIHPDDREWFQKAFATMLTHGSTDLTFRVVRPDGQVRVIRGIASVEYDDTGKPILNYQ